MKRLYIALLVAIMFPLLMGASCPKQEGGAGPTDHQLFVKAEELYEAGDYEAAQKIYQEIMERFPGSEYANHAQFRMGQIYYKMGRKDDALSEFRHFVERNRGTEEGQLAQDYVVRILEHQIQSTVGDYEEKMITYEHENFRLDMMNRYLRKSVDSEIIYIEMDLDADRLFVKLGTQTLYEYPIVT